MPQMQVICGTPQKQGKCSARHNTTVRSRITMRRAFILTMALALGAGVGTQMAGWFFYSLVSRFLLIWVAIPVSIILLSTASYLIWKRQRAGGLSGFALCCVYIVIFVLGFSGSGPTILRFRAADLTAFMDDTIPKLDAHKRQFGHYPSSLSEVTSSDLPYYLKGRGGYTSNGTGYTFYYEPPGSIISGMMRTDIHRRWVRAD